MKNKLKFTINEEFLCAHTLYGVFYKTTVPYISKKHLSSIENMRQLIMDKKCDLETLDLIIERRALHFYDLMNKSYQHQAAKADECIKKLTKTKEFLAIKQETLESIKKLEEEWDKNYEVTSKFIRSLGIKIKGDFEVFVTHPGLMTGRYLENNQINWSYQEYYANYNTIYLWHEILHSYFGYNDGEHALIEFITDNEMRVLLNGGAYPPFEGHSQLNTLKYKLLPKWKKYLDSDKKDFNKLREEFRRVSEEEQKSMHS